MVTLDYELNLSKTEYLYYLKCPQKFRIHRLLNPIPYKMTFMNTKRTPTNYILRNYDERKTTGIMIHAFFESFHRNYWSRIKDTEPPIEIASNQIKLLYWLYQQKKYHNNPDYWIPHKMELRLMTERQRGIIDCVEMCSNEDGLRIIDYKPKPRNSDKLSLLFYANLLNEFRLEKKEYDVLLYNVAEIGCYYYELGIEKIFELGTSELLIFQENFSYILEQISQENLTSSSSCFNCSYYDICKIDKRSEAQFEILW